MMVTRKLISIDREGQEAWERLSENFVMSKLISNILVSFEHNFAKYSRLVNLDLLPDDIFDKMSDGDIEWITLFKHLKSVAGTRNRGLVLFRVFFSNLSKISKVQNTIFDLIS